MSPLKFSFLFYATAVACGILAKDCFTLLVGGLLFVPLLGGLVFVAYSKKTWLLHPFAFYGTAMIFYLLSFLLGFMAVHYVDWKDDQNSYVAQVVDQQPYAISYRIVEKYKKTKRGFSYVVAVEGVDGKQTQGKALLLSLDSVLEVGTQFRAIGIFHSFPTATNPGQLDYRVFMQRKHIAKQLQVQQEVAVGQNTSIYAKLMQVRAVLQQHIEHNGGLSLSSKALLSALLLGDKNQMEEQAIGAFQQLGLMHILAISGLHIGVIAVFINQLTSFLKTRYRQLILVILLWIFVFIAGFSPSVFRTVLMCTLLMLSQGMKRKQTTRECIGLALFFSLLFEPYWLFDVGFQLSYAAVLGLVVLMPLFKGCYTQSRIGNYCLGLLYVSLVAQLSVLPLQLYYFHSFSWTFLGSNLLVIPLITLLVLSGFCLWCFGWISPAIALGLGWVIEQTVRLIFTVLRGLEEINLLVTTAYISKEMAVILVLLSCSLVWVLYRPRMKQMVYLVSLLLLTQLSCFHLIRQRQAGEEFIIAAVQGRNPLYIQEVDQQLLVFGEEEQTKGLVEAYEQYYLPQVVVKKPRADWYQVDVNRKLLVLSKQHPYYPVQTKFEVIYLVDNVPVNIERILTLHQPQQLVLGYALSAGYKKRVIQYCIKKNIPFHDLREKGYWSSQFR